MECHWCDSCRDSPWYGRGGLGVEEHTALAHPSNGLGWVLGHTVDGPGQVQAGMLSQAIVLPHAIVKGTAQGPVRVLATLQVRTAWVTPHGAP